MDSQDHVRDSIYIRWTCRG